MTTTTESVTMATFPLCARRLLLAGGFAVAVAAAPALAMAALPTSAPATSLACPVGEEEDLFIGECVPHTSPNVGVSSVAGNPSLPAVNGIPCTGGNTGECIGLSEEQQAMGPAPEPESTVSHSPTITSP